MSGKQEVLSYKGYFGSAEISMEDRGLVGHVLYIDDLVMYEGSNFDELEDGFKRSIDDYLETCQQIGRQPQKSYSGTFNVRIGPDMHSRAAIAATRAGESLNDYVRQAIARRLETGFMQIEAPSTSSSAAVSVLSRPLVGVGTPRLEIIGGHTVTRYRRFAAAKHAFPVPSNPKQREH